MLASAGSRLCPTGWAGVVVLGNAGIATVPVNSLISPVRKALAQFPINTVTDANCWRTTLPIKDLLAGSGYFESGAPGIAYLLILASLELAAMVAIAELPVFLLVNPGVASIGSSDSPSIGLLAHLLLIIGWLGY